MQVDVQNDDVNASVIIYKNRVVCTIVFHLLSVSPAASSPLLSSDWSYKRHATF